MGKELEELKKSIAKNSTMKKWAKQTAEAQKTIADAINNSKGIHSLDAFYDTPKIIHKPPVNIDKEEWKEIKSFYSGKFTTLDVDMNWIECCLDNLYEQWQKGSYPDKVAFFEALDNQFDGLANMYMERKKRDYTSTELFTHYFDEWEKVAYQVKWDGSKVDGLLIDEVIEIETDIEIYLKKRTKHGLELTDTMRQFKGIVKLADERLDAVLKEEAQQPKEELSDGYPPIDEVEDWNGALYTLGDHLLDLWETFKNSQDYSCFKNREDFFTWCSHKWTYKRGNVFTAKSLALSIRVARARGRID